MIRSYKSKPLLIKNSTSNLTVIKLHLNKSSPKNTNPLLLFKSASKRTCPSRIRFYLENPLLNEYPLNIDTQPSYRMGQSVVEKRTFTKRYSSPYLLSNVYFFFLSFTVIHFLYLDIKLTNAH